MGRLTERIIAGMLVMFLLVYVCYQAYRYFKSPLQMEAVFSYSVSHSVSVEGIVVRSETPITERRAGIENYIYEDGTRVAVGQTVVEYYSSAVNDRNVQRSREIEREIRMLTEAQDPAVSNYANTEGFNRDIRDRLGQLTLMSSNGRYDSLTDVKSSLVSLLSKKRISTGRENSYENRIDTLQSEYERLGTETAGSLDAVSAPVSGYFVSDMDGLEQILSPDSLDDCAIEDYYNLVRIVEEAPEPQGGTGRIVTNENWYFAALAPEYDIQMLSSGSSVEIRFEEIDFPVPATVVDIQQEKDHEDALLILKSNRITGDLLRLRTATATVYFNQYTGLRINTANVRFQEDERGVYVLEKNTVVFKRLDPVYEEAGFILSRPGEGPDANELVALYDQIITKGMDLYDGKVVE